MDNPSSQKKQTYYDTAKKIILNMLEGKEREEWLRLIDDVRNRRREYLRSLISGRKKRRELSDKMTRLLFAYLFGIIKPRKPTSSSTKNKWAVTPRASFTFRSIFGLNYDRKEYFRIYHRKRRNALKGLKHLMPPTEKEFVPSSSLSVFSKETTELNRRIKDSITFFYDEVDVSNPYGKRRVPPPLPPKGTRWKKKRGTKYQRYYRKHREERRKDSRRRYYAQRPVILEKKSLKDKEFWKNVKKLKPKTEDKLPISTLKSNTKDRNRINSRRRE